MPDNAFFPVPSAPNKPPSEIKSGYESGYELAAKRAVAR